MVRGSGDGGPTGPAPAGWSTDDLARRLVQVVVDVVHGHRPASQLLRWTTPEVYAALRERARVEQARERRGRPSGGDGAAGRRPAEARRPVVRSVRTVRAGDDAAEVCAVVLDGTRARAVAARLDAGDGRWRLTALHVG
ncbi:Rv3235 family protein [Aquipuribacter sp. SD81]|uniref:Rv3235 family protein n=1 Tax=Aquipuribacter sp. SD81 TaxID=3127703 RepID=UPI0030198DBF